MNPDPDATPGPEPSWQSGTSGPPPTRREDPTATGHRDGPPATRREDPGEDLGENIGGGAGERAGEGTGERAGGGSGAGPASDREADDRSGGLLLLPEPLRGTWQVVRELPGGGEADVILVQDREGLERVVKIYRRHITLDVEVSRRLVGLNRTHLLGPERTGHDHGRHWELMEYVPGGSLADHLDRVGTTLPRAEIDEVIRQIADALAELHQARLTHSDLKPSNILIRRAAPLALVLSDFGLSKYLGDASKRFTQRAHTVAYAAPESFSGRYSPAQDWWALGMIVRQLATGEAPFAGLSERVALHELLVRDVSLDGITDERLRLLCRGLLVRDPDHRWSETQVRSWLAGDSPRVHAAADVRVSRPLIVAGQTCWTRAEAARAFATHWDRARQTFLERIGTPGEPGEGWRLLRSWLEQFDEDVEQRIRLIDQVLTADVPPDLRMVHLLRWLDPTMPPTYRNRSLLPEHVATVAAAETGPDPASWTLRGASPPGAAGASPPGAAGASPPGAAGASPPGAAGATPPGIVSDLWRYQLLGLLAQFAGGAELVDVDQRWRSSAARLDSLRSDPTLPAPARDALARAGVPQLAALLRAAADPDLPQLLAQRATGAREAIGERPPWFDALRDVRDPAVALAVLTVAPLAQAEYARILAERNRGRLTWEREEQARAAGRSSALGYAAAAAGIWGVVMLTGALAANAGGGLPGLDSDTPDGASNGTLLIFVLFGFLWLVSATAELAVAYYIGAAYHPQWSAISALRRFGRRVPDAWGFVRRTSNSVRANTPPIILTLACCLGCCFLGPLLSLGGFLYALLTLGATAGQLGWALVRAIRFDRLRTQRRRDLLGDAANQKTSPTIGRSNSGGGHL